MTAPTAPQRRRLSAFVICRNEADRIEPCLASLKGWADEIVVLDSGSTDNTVDIARRYATTVLETDWPGYGPQRNRALALLGGDWVLSLDADERVTPELRDEIDRVLAEPDLDATVLKAPWRTYFLGKRLKHGRYTSPQAKFFVRAGTRYRDHQVHESLLMDQPRVERILKHGVDHHSWRSYAHAQQKHLQYACLLAEQKAAKGKTSNLAYASLRFFTDFTREYVFRLGLLDGKAGFLIAVMLGQYAFHKYAALTARPKATAAPHPPDAPDA